MALYDECEFVGAIHKVRTQVGGGGSQKRTIKRSNFPTTCVRGGDNNNNNGSLSYFSQKVYEFFLHKNREDLCLIFMKTANSHHVPFWTYIYQKMGQTESIGSK